MSRFRTRTKRAALRTVAVAFVAVIVLDQAGCEPRPDVLIGAGDIAECGKTGDSFTARLVTDISGEVITFGDLAYEDGTAREFRDCYVPTWGRHDWRVHPSPGNHEYRDPRSRWVLRLLRPKSRTGQTRHLPLRQGRLAHLLAEQRSEHRRRARPMCGPTPGGSGASPRTGTSHCARPASTAAAMPWPRCGRPCTTSVEIWCSTGTTTTMSGSPSSVGPDCPEPGACGRSSSAPAALGTTPSTLRFPARRCGTTPPSA